MFIRRKVVRGVTYYAVVENQRPRSDEEKPHRWRTARDGKVKQRTVVSLGQHPTIEAALDEARNEFAYHQQHAEQGYRENRHGIYVGITADRHLVNFPMGRAAQKRADKWKSQIERLEAALAVVSKKVPKRNAV